MTTKTPVSLQEVTTQTMAEKNGNAKRSIVFSQEADNKIEAARKITGLPKSALVRLAVMNYDYSQLTHEWERS